MTYREIAWNLAQGGQLELAMAAWTMENLRQIAQGKPPDPVVEENLRQAGAWLAQSPKDGFSSQDDELLRTLVDLQREIGNHDNLQHAIDTLLNEWRTSPNPNLYDWTLNTIRSTKGPEDRVLVLAAIGQYLERCVEQTRCVESSPAGGDPEIGTTIRSRA
ncbi:MAG: hypothetical protein M1492_01620 [Gammaproteobacteria bacterium]|jgi:hypothetical protein|nr:hypothetical protein [Gammaproteobacteria bacterium]